MPIIQVPFRSVEATYDESLCAKYQRVGFFTLSDLSPTISFDLEFTPHDDDAYDELCVGVVVASAETYGHLSELDVTVSPHLTYPNEMFFVHSFPAVRSPFLIDQRNLVMPLSNIT
jgi:hypothetical protein